SGTVLHDAVESGGGVVVAGDHSRCSSDAAADKVVRGTCGCAGQAVDGLSRAIQVEGCGYRATESVEDEITLSGTMRHDVGKPRGHLERIRAARAVGIVNHGVAIVVIGERRVADGHRAAAVGRATAYDQTSRPGY